GRRGGAVPRLRRGDVGAGERVHGRGRRWGGHDAEGLTQRPDDLSGLASLGAASSPGPSPRPARETAAPPPGGSTHAPDHAWSSSSQNPQPATTAANRTSAPESRSAPRAQRRGRPSARRADTRNSATAATMPKKTPPAFESRATAMRSSSIAAARRHGDASGSPSSSGATAREAGVMIFRGSCGDPGDRPFGGSLPGATVRLRLEPLVRLPHQFLPLAPAHHPEADSLRPPRPRLPPPRPPRAAPP